MLRLINSLLFVIGLHVTFDSLISHVKMNE